MDSGDRDTRTQTVCLLILATVAVAAALYWLRPVMVPFVLALFLSFALAPLIDLLVRRLRTPRWLAVLLALVLGVGALGSLGALVSMSVTQMAARSGEYQAQIEKMLASLAESLPLEKLGIDPAIVTDPLSRVQGEAIGSVIVGSMRTLFGNLSQGALVLIFLLFLLMGRTTRQGPPLAFWAEVESRIKLYVITKLMTSALTGTLVWIVLAWLDIELALVFGLLAFLLNFIPSIGSIIATLLPLPVVLVSPDVTTSAAVMAIAIPGAIQFTIGNVVEPKILGESLDLHPVAILISLIFWGALWGIVGMLLAVPITAVIKILLGRLEVTAPIADLLAGRLDGPRDRDAQGAG